MAEPEIRYTTTADGVSIAHYAMGEGHPLLITSSVLWSHLRIQPVREYHRSRSGHGLGRGLRVVRYDSRGTGLSDRAAIDFGLDARLADIDAVVDHLGLERFAMMGAGHGSLAAIAYAARHPERVSQVVLAEPYARGSDFREHARRWDSLMDASDEDWERYTLTMANADLNFTDSDFGHRLAALFRESMTLQSVRAFLAALDAIDVTPDLGLIAAPTLVLHRGSPGKILPLEWSQSVAAQIRDARFVTFPQRADLAWTDEQTRAVESFLGLTHDGPMPSGTSWLSSPGRAASASRTILYTDIEGNTDMLQRLGDERWRTVLRDHERITREMLRVHDGTEVKTTGDGFLASFDSATRAVECAISLQCAFADRNETADDHLLVRVGLNAGEPIEEDDDLFGTAVTLAARIMGQSAGGQILVSDVVRGLVAGKGFVMVDRDEFVPKGFDEPTRLFEVSWRPPGEQQ